MAGPTNPADDARIHPVAPLNWLGNLAEWARKSSEVINGIMQGRTNNRGTVTLTVTGTATPLLDPLIGADSVVSLQAVNEAARNLLPNVTSFTDGACVLHHSPASLSSSVSTTTGTKAVPIYDYVVWS